jgi:hypothetical protein
MCYVIDTDSRPRTRQDAFSSRLHPGPNQTVEAEQCPTDILEHIVLRLAALDARQLGSSRHKSRDQAQMMYTQAASHACGFASCPQHARGKKCKFCSTHTLSYTPTHAHTHARKHTHTHTEQTFYFDEIYGFCMQCILVWRSMKKACFQSTFTVDRYKG